ncbi:MAG: hypothetical protein JXM73_04670 [Anaerolineae bacterium]|nr:hypothetical protein [Anaerolineae bacterium]
MSKVVFVLFLLLALILLYFTLVVECQMGAGCGIVNAIQDLLGIPRTQPACSGVCPDAGLPTGPGFPSLAAQPAANLGRAVLTARQQDRRL